VSKIEGVLSRNSTDMWREWNKLQTQSGGLFGEPLKLLLLVFGFIEFNSSVYVVMAKLQHPVGQAGEHVRHRGDRFGCPEFGAQPTELGSQSALASQQGRGRQS
jgi:hypothetical protein